MLQREVTQLRQELDKLKKSDRYVFEKDIEMANGRNIILSTGATSGSGTIIGTTTTQKLGFYGTTPTTQPASVVVASGCTGNADTAVNQLRARIEALGLISA